MKRLHAFFIMVMMAFCTYGQIRTSVIIDNDFSGDPDGLYALAHLMSSTSVDVNAYRLCLMSNAVLAKRLGDSAIGRYLNSKLSQFIGQNKQAEAYVLGDNPLVLLSALRSNWEPDASSSVYEWRDRPAVLDNGRFLFGTNESKVRVYRSLDIYLLFEDMFAKLKD